MEKKSINIEGTPYAVKVARTVWRRGKEGDNIEFLPIPISKKETK